MAFTYDLTSSDPVVAARSVARMYGTDTDPAAALFGDAEWDAFLASNVGPKRAAAAALDTAASSLAIIMRVVKSGLDSTDGRATAAALRGQAQALRDQADRDADDGAAVDVLDFDPFAGFRAWLAGG